ncbi:DUF4339 domain-containing protein [Coraliomargarita sp. W4R72]
MPDYYIRTPEQDESRGPFDISKLVTLAEAGQINPNTLYYDEDKEEWIPLELNTELHALVFPEREKLALKVDETKKAKTKDVSPKGLDIEAMLAAAEGDTAEKRKLTRQKKSFERAATLSASGLGLMMIFSALFMVLPLISQIQEAFGGDNFAVIFNYPTILVGIFDLIIAVLLLLAVTEVFPLARGRAMLTLGFGAYVGWAIGDPLMIGLSVAAGVGTFLATISQRMSTMILALALGIGGNAYLAYLALDGRFDGFFDRIVMNLVAN